VTVTARAITAPSASLNVLELIVLSLMCVDVCSAVCGVTAVVVDVARSGEATAGPHGSQPTPDAITFCISHFAMGITASAVAIEC